MDRYLNDFSKALASEVRILLAEVGKLRDERRQLQLCVSFCYLIHRFSFTPFRLPRICLHTPDTTKTNEMNSEIAELMAVKSKHGAGGEYSPNWAPPVSRHHHLLF